MLEKPKNLIDGKAFWEFIKSSCPLYDDIEKDPAFKHFTPGHYQAGWIGALDYIEELLKKSKVLD